MYFDYNATHPPIRSIIEPIWQEYWDEYSNPSGATRFSLTNQGKIEEARDFFSRNDHFPLEGHIFSSTGTEANHILVSGLRKKYPDTEAIYTSGMEHSSFYAALEFFGFRPIFIQSLKNGEVDPEDLKNKMDSHPLPVGIIYACNETGVVQPMEEISTITRSKEKHLISDCMQAFGKIIIDYSLLDGYTSSGHKIGAGLGSAITGFSESLLPSSLSFMGGGNQENGYRAGTENWVSIQCFHRAAEHQIQKLGGSLFTNLLIQREIDSHLESLGAEIVGKASPRLPNTIFSILPLEDLDFFMMGMEERGIQISTGSSCKSRAREASPALLHMGYSEERALSAIRISWGLFTRPAEVDNLKKNIEELIRDLSDIQN